MTVKPSQLAIEHWLHRVPLEQINKCTKSQKDPPNSYGMTAKSKHRQAHMDHTYFNKARALPGPV